MRGELHASPQSADELEPPGGGVERRGEPRRTARRWHSGADGTAHRHLSSLNTHLMQDSDQAQDTGAPISALSDAGTTAFAETGEAITAAR